MVPRKYVRLAVRSSISWSRALLQTSGTSWYWSRFVVSTGSRSVIGPPRSCACDFSVEPRGQSADDQGDDDQGGDDVAAGQQEAGRGVGVRGGERGSERHDRQRDRGAAERPRRVGCPASERDGEQDAQGAREQHA